MATGEHGTATKHGEYMAGSFDDAVRQYAEEHPNSVHPLTRESFMSQEYYEKRRSNWVIWGCKLFDNERDARKAFG